MKNAPHLFGSKTKKLNRKTNSKLSTRQQSYTLLTGHKITGNSIHKSLKLLDFEAGCNINCTRVKSIQKATRRR